MAYKTIRVRAARPGTCVPLIDENGATILTRPHRWCGANPDGTPRVDTVVEHPHYHRAIEHGELELLAEGQE